MPYESESESMRLGPLLQTPLDFLLRGRLRGRGGQPDEAIGLSLIDGYHVRVFTMRTSITPPKRDSFFLQKLKGEREGAREREGERERETVRQMTGVMR